MSGSLEAVKSQLMKLFPDTFGRKKKYDALDRVFPVP